jgi:uncharacterized membrane protein
MEFWATILGSLLVGVLFGYIFRGFLNLTNTKDRRELYLIIGIFVIIEGALMSLISGSFAYAISFALGCFSVIVGFALTIETLNKFRKSS